MVCMLKRALFFIFLSIFGLLNLSFAQASLSEEMRAEEILEKDKALREQLGAPQKLYIKEIVIEGATLISKEDIEEILLTYQRNWFTQEDIRNILKDVKEAYAQKGYANKLDKISYQIKDKQLIVAVEESTAVGE